MNITTNTSTLRQKAGFANSFSSIDLDIPYFSTLSNRSIDPKLSAQTNPNPKSLMIVDSTGIKVYGKSEWHQEKYDAKSKGRT
ncbi:transposase [Legionella sainthelensi]|uniref:transposase n=1 Tax=Legionella sainthelensi TaxID=28087 RepID=UPI000E1FBE5F